MSRATLAHYVVLCGADRFGDTLRYSGLTIVAAVAYGDAWLLTALGLARFLPWLLVGPAAGVLADRLGNHRVAVRANVVKAVTTAALAVAIVAHAPAAVLVLAAAVTSVAGVALDAATSSWLPRLVGPDELATANSRLSTVQSVSSLLAPTLAGVAVTTASGLCYALALVAAVAVAALELGAMSGADPREGHRRLAEVSMTAAVRVGFAGLASLWGDRSLRPLTVAIQLLNVAGGYQLVVFPLLLVRRGGGDGVSIGALMALQSAGMIGGNVLARRLVGHGARHRVLRATTAACVAQVVVFAGLGLGFQGSATVWVDAALVVVLGCFSGVWNVASTTYLMSSIAGDVMGVTLAGYRSVAMIAAPVGSALAGVVLATAVRPDLVYAAPVLLAAGACLVLGATAREAAHDVARVDA